MINARCTAGTPAASIWTLVPDPPPPRRPATSRGAAELVRARARSAVAVEPPRSACSLPVGLVVAVAPTDHDP